MSLLHNASHAMLYDSYTSYFLQIYHASYCFREVNFRYLSLVLNNAFMCQVKVGCRISCVCDLARYSMLFAIWVYGLYIDSKNKYKRVFFQHVSFAVKWKIYPFRVALSIFGAFVLVSHQVANVDTIVENTVFNAKFDIICYMLQQTYYRSLQRTETSGLSCFCQ